MQFDNPDNLEFLPILTLRKLATSIGIKNVKSMTKSSLLLALKAASADIINFRPSLGDMSVAELKKIAKTLGVTNFKTKKKGDLIKLLQPLYEDRYTKYGFYGEEESAHYYNLARAQGIEGYSTMTKQEIIDLLESETGQEVEEPVKPEGPTVPSGYPALTAPVKPEDEEPGVSITEKEIIESPEDTELPLAPLKIFGPSGPPSIQLPSAPSRVFGPSFPPSIQPPSASMITPTISRMPSSISGVKPGTQLPAQERARPLAIPDTEIVPERRSIIPIETKVEKFVRPPERAEEYRLERLAEKQEKARYKSAFDAAADDIEKMVRLEEGDDDLDRILKTMRDIQTKFVNPELQRDSLDSSQVHIARCLGLL